MDKCMLNKSIVVSLLDITSFREIEEMSWAELMQNMGRREMYWEVNLKKREIIQNKCTQLIRYQSLQMNRTEMWRMRVHYSNASR